MGTKVMIDEGAYMPERAHEWDAGADLRTPVCVTCKAHGSCVVDTGVHIQIPVGSCGQLWSKSGLNVKNDLTGTGLIDAGYTGSIRVKLYNNGDSDYTFNRGDKLIQIVIVKVNTDQFEKVDKFEATERGDKGFGSTGK